MFMLALMLALVAPTQIHLLQSLHGGREWSTPYSLDEILDAIRSVETGGLPYGGSQAVGDGGRALGPFQIHREHWMDSGMAGRYEDCRDPLYARREVLAYWQRWCPRALAERNAEVLARVHNGGPRGDGKASTQGYWSKTSARLAATRAERGVTRVALVPGVAALAR